jgi:hypothetical protein
MMLKKSIFLTLTLYMVPQSRFYSRVFRVSAIKMPPYLFSKRTSAIAGKDMNMNAYKKHIGGYISKIKLRDFNRKPLALTQKALKNVHMLLVLNDDCARRRTIKKENMSLNQPANRGAL